MRIPVCGAGPLGSLFAGVIAHAVTPEGAPSVLVVLVIAAPMAMRRAARAL